MGATHTAIKIVTAPRQIIFSRRVIEEISTCKLDDGRNAYSKKITLDQSARPAAKNFTSIKRHEAPSFRCDSRIVRASCLPSDNVRKFLGTDGKP